MTGDQNTVVVRERIEAFNDGDLERLMAGFTEDALWITGRTTVRGRDELRSFFGAAIKGLRPNLALRNLIVDDCHAACQMIETLVVVDHQERRGYSIAAFFQLHEGLIASAKVYREGSAEVG